MNVVKEYFDTSIDNILSHLLLGIREQNVLIQFYFILECNHLEVKRVEWTNRIDLRISR